MNQADFIHPGESLENVGKDMIIYGPAGVGKTSLIKTLLGWTHEGGWDSQEPLYKPEEVLVLSADAGASVLYKEKKLVVTMYNISEGGLDKFKELVQWLMTGDHPFKLIAIDNVSELEKYFVFNLAVVRGKDLPQQKEWGDASVKLRKYMRDLRKLVFRKIDVLFMFWDMVMPLKDAKGEETSVICPMCMRKTWKEYVGIVEHYAYMGTASIKTSTFLPGDRFLQFDTYGMVQAKTRSEKLGGGMPGKFEAANLGEVFKKI